MEHLRGYLVTTRPEDMQLQIQALDTLGVLARTVGNDAFSPLVEECAMLGLGLIDQVDDPDLRRCTYGLFASLSVVMGASMAPHLERMTTRMLLSLRSTDGVVTHYNEEGGDEEGGARSFLLLDDDGLEEEEGEEEEGDEEEDITSEECRSFDDDDDDVAGYSVGNAYVEEKEDACNALGEIAVNTGAAFLPFLEATFTDVFKMVEYPAEDVRKAALRGLAQLCVALHAACKQQPSAPSLDALRRMLCVTVPCLCLRARSERDRHVAMAALEAQNELLAACGAEAMASVPGALDDVTSLLRDVLQRKVTCQGHGAGDEGDDDGGGDDEEQQAEYDAMLLEFAGEGVPLVAKALGGGEEFAPYFAGFLPMLLTKMRRGSTASERSLAVGVLAETVAALGCGCCRRFAGRLLPALAESARDADAEVRSNAVYGLGVLVHGASDALAAHLPKLLGLLSSLLSHEENRRVVDNACGALARTICSASATLAVPVELVFPALLQALPLVEDLEENSAVFSCVTQLYQGSLPQVMQNLGPVLRAVGHVLGTTQITEAVEASLRVMLLDLSQRHPAEFHAALSTLPADVAAALS
ncbi:importin-4-like isoform X2 [Lampetra fluviatilis]